MWDLGDPDLLKLCVQTTLTAGWGLVDTLLIVEAGALQGNNNGFLKATATPHISDKAVSATLCISDKAVPGIII